MAPLDSGSPQVPVPSALEWVRPRTLAELIARAATDPELPAGRRTALVSDVGSFARLLGLDADREPPAIAAHRTRMAQFHPAAAGISAKRWSNIRSSVTFAIQRYGASKRGRPLPRDLDPDWRAMRNLLNAHGDVRIVRGLSALIHFCNRNAIAPSDVDDGTLEQFLTFKRESTTCRKPERVQSEACRVWNLAAARVLGWPQRRLAVPFRRDLIRLPWDEFTAEFRADVDRWAKERAADDLFAEGGTRTLRATTINTRREQLHRFASACVRGGVPIERIGSLADLVEPTVLKVGLEFYFARFGRELRASLQEILAGLVAIARHHVKLAPEKLEVLVGYQQRARCRPRQLTQKNRDRLRQFEDELTLARLLALPERLVALAAKLSHPRKAAIAFQTAVAIEILLTVPLRLENLRTLRFGVHLRESANRRRGPMFLVIEGDDTKNASPIEVELPPHLRQLLSIYRQRHHGALAPKGGSCLFPAGDGSDAPKNQVTLREQIVKAVARHVGAHMNPHLFRHLAAFNWLRARPGDYGTVARLLGHRSVQTSYQFYSGLEQAHAARRYDDHVLALRQQLGKEPKR